MFKPKDMSRAIIVGHKDIFEDTVNALHDTNTFHMENFNEDGSGFKIGRPFENAGDVSKKLVKLRSISNFLGIKPREQAIQNADQLWSELDSNLVELEKKVSVKTDQRNELDARLKELESLKRELAPFSGISVDLSLYRGYENIAVITGIVQGDVTSAISHITTSYEIEYDPEAGTLVLFIKREDVDKVSEVLTHSGFRELKVPDIIGIPASLLTQIETENIEINKTIENLDAEVVALKEKYSNFILASDEILSIESQKSEAPLRIASSEHTFVIDGWIPDEDYDALASTINDATDGHAFVSKQEVEKEDEDNIPVKYDNPKISSPFEAIMDLYARPKYKEIDPTNLIFFTFPLFYGMILGDIGYALILLVLAFGINRMVKSDAIKPLMNIFLYCQISTLIFGVLYGEFLGFSLASVHTAHGVEAGLIAGFETVNLFPSPIGGEMVTYPIHRTHLVMTLIVLTTLIGVVHINMGYILGFINENRKHGITAAMLEKGSWLIEEIGIVLIVLGYLGYIPIAIGVVVFIGGFIMLVKGEGIKGPIELPSLLSNSLSYTRLIAVGLSSIYIASTVNLIAFERIMSSGGITMTIFAIIVFIFGHALNTILSIIAPGLHSLRLQYVEFFTKFYEGGGRKYNPFGYIRKYTEE
ncbi:MAG: V-type ATP synthase subunit I [Euryarchaeota archaeon]|nr:V-type ATP synthase subunit I [Euryarchaeota archaeon]